MLEGMRAFITSVVHKVRTIWRRVPTALRAGWITAAITFFGAALSILTGLLPVLAEAISSGNYEPFFDRLSLEGTAAVSASAAFAAGLVNTIWRWLVPITAAYQTTPPPPE